MGNSKRWAKKKKSPKPGFNPWSHVARNWFKNTKEKSCNCLCNYTQGVKGKLKKKKKENSVHHIMSPSSGLCLKEQLGILGVLNASFIFREVRIPKDIFYSCVNKVSACWVCLLSIYNCTKFKKSIKSHTIQAQCSDYGIGTYRITASKHMWMQATDKFFC